MVRKNSMLAIFIGFVFALFLSFLPIFLNTGLTDEAGAVDNIQLSPNVRDAFVFSFAISLILLIELWLDIFSSWRQSFMSRCFRVFALIVPNILMIAFLIPFGLLKYVPCVICSQLVLLVFTFGSNLNEFGKGTGIWDARSTSVMVLMFILSAILSSYTAFFERISSPLINNAFLVFGLAIFCYNSFKWWKYIYYLSVIKNQKMNNHEYICTVFVSCISLYLCFLVVAAVIFAVGMNFDTSLFWYCNYTYSGSILILFVSLLSDRVLRRELVTAQVTLIRHICLL